MGCGGSKAVKEYLDDHKEGSYGKESDLELAIQHIEAHHKSSMTKIVEMRYIEKSNGSEIQDAQQWVIHGNFSDEKNADATYSVWIAQDGKHEVAPATFTS